MQKLDINKIFKCKIVNIFLPISFNIVLGAQKSRLIETVLLSTHNICCGWEIRKIFVCYALLTSMTKGMKMSIFHFTTLFSFVVLHGA